MTYISTHKLLERGRDITLTNGKTRALYKRLDVARALGIYLLIGGNMFNRALPGGFLGAGVIFAFTGFLITAVIMEETQKNGGFNIFIFYLRRFTRILPPVILSVIFTLPLTFLIPKDDTAGINGRMYAHMWIILYEICFNAIWGLVCAALAALTAWAFYGRKNLRLTFFKISVFTAALLLSIVFYYGTSVRLFPFFIGGAAAALWGLWREFGITVRPQRTQANSFDTAAALFAIIAAAVIIVFAILSSESGASDFRGSYLLISLLTLCIICGVLSLNCISPRANEPVPLKAAVCLSYYCLLFHLPLYAVVPALVENSLAAIAVTLAIMFIFSAIVFYGFEDAFRPDTAYTRKDRRRKSQSRFFHLRNAAAIAVIIIAIPFSAAALVRMPAAEITAEPATTAVENITKPVTTAVKNTAEPKIAANEPEAASESKPGAAPDTAEAENKPDAAPDAAEPENTPDITPNSTETENKPGPAPGAATENKPNITAPESTPDVTPDITTENTPDVTPDIITEIKAGVTVIGDSVALGAKEALTDTIDNCYVEAKVSQGISGGYDVFADLKNRGELREYIVIALGTNSSGKYEELLTKFINDTNPGHRLVFVTPYDGRFNQNSDTVAKTAAWERKLESRYDFITIADWNTVIAAQENLLSNDRVHLGGAASAQLFADCVAQALANASLKPKKM